MQPPTLAALFESRCKLDLRRGAPIAGRIRKPAENEVQQEKTISDWTLVYIMDTAVLLRQIYRMPTFWHITA